MSVSSNYIPFHIAIEPVGKYPKAIVQYAVSYALKSNLLAYFSYLTHSRRHLCVNNPKFNNGADKRTYSTI